MQKLAVALLVTFLGSTSFASHEIVCQVTDVQGKVLPAQVSVTDKGQRLEGSSELFSYSVSRTSEAVVIELTDKRSGDKAIVEEGDFATDEKVNLSLVTDEQPDQRLKLSCVRPSHS